MKYTVAIRTLGKAGKFYQKELDSICTQTIQPEAIIIYIAEGYPIPKETCGRERYVYVKKGMVAQRALPYDEIDTEYVLFLDDDVFLPHDAVERLLKLMNDYGADVISPNTFDNHKQTGMAKWMNILLSKAVPSSKNDFAYRVLRSGGFAYHPKPIDDFYWSESNAGPCFLCKKSTFLDIHFEDELWLDQSPYALPDDQVMFYKMYLKGYKVATAFNTGIIHLDAGTAVRSSADREQKMLYSEVKNQIIFWHRFIKPYNKGLMRIWAIICINHYKNMRRLLALKNKLCGNSASWKTVNLAISDANTFIEQL